MKVYIWVLSRPSPEYGKPASGARLTIIAEDEPAARRVLEGFVPQGMTVDEILFRKLIHETQPIVFEAENYGELIMNSNWRTKSLVHGQRVGVT